MENQSAGAPSSKNSEGAASLTYHLSILTDHKIFSDEVDKYRLLSMVKEEKTVGKWSVYAFSLLDDRLDLLLNGKEEQEKGAVDFGRYILSRYETYYENKRGKPEKVEVQIDCRSLSADAELARSCMRIHLLCMKEKYVRKLKDYWWSSYQTYRGEYDWKFVDTAPLMKVMHLEGKKAGKQFQSITVHTQKMDIKSPDNAKKFENHLFI